MIGEHDALLDEWDALTGELSEAHQRAKYGPASEKKAAALDLKKIQKRLDELIEKLEDYWNKEEGR